ncbi:Fc.00g097300.m01.CDS01 [Cosmosporella sp. VM-42]
MAPPNFSDPALFPAFRNLPVPDAETGSSEWWLVAQVKENMTITKPTLIVTDIDGEDFAVTFEESVDLKPWRKGSCFVLPQARRTIGKEGKKGFVTVPRGEGAEAKVVLGGWEVVRKWEERREEVCATCGTEGAKTCTGCESVKYCGKVSLDPWRNTALN